MSDADARGRFVWYELLTANTDAAVSFYSSVTGWGTQVWEAGPGPYTMFTREGTPLSGLMTLPEEARAAGARSHWLPYVGTPDVDATTADASRLGAETMVAPADVPSVGRFAVLRDPQGAVFAVFKAQGDWPGHDGPPAVGEFSWHELATTDHAAAFGFYHQLFGWDKADAMDMGTAGLYQMYARKGQLLGGMYNKPKEMPAPPHWLLYIRVPDAHKALEPIKAGGGQVLNGPMEVPGGDWVAQCLDPQGAPFAVHSTVAAKS